MAQIPFEPVFRVSYSKYSGGGVQRKYFNSAEACREWYVNNRKYFSSSAIVEMNYIPFERLVMLAQCERECEALGVRD